MLLIPKVELARVGSIMHIDCFFRTLNVSNQFGSISNITNVKLHNTVLKPNIDNTHWFAEISHEIHPIDDYIELTVNVGTIEYKYTTKNVWKHYILVDDV